MARGSGGGHGDRVTPVNPLVTAGEVAPLATSKVHALAPDKTGMSKGGTEMRERRGEVGAFGTYMNERPLCPLGYGDEEWERDECALARERAAAGRTTAIASCPRHGAYPEEE